MAKTKFQTGDPVKPNHKAPLYLRARAENGSTFEIVEGLGEGYYNIKDLSDGEIFKTAGSGLDIVESVPSPEGAQSVIDTLQDAEATAKAVGIELEPEKTPEVDRSTLTHTVRSFISATEQKIEKVEEEIKPQKDQILNYGVAIALAEKLNRVPSPKVWKLMHELIQLNPALGELSIHDLYIKAEGVLETTLEA